MSARPVVKVSALVRKVSAYLTNHVNLSNVAISGEISNLRNVKGHLYFDLKDDQGQMACVMWKTNAARLNFRPQDGMEVLLHAQLSIYAPRGSLQLVAEGMELSGEGQLLAMLEERKRRLEREGYFNPAHKHRKPEWINRIAIITGNDTAALKDVEKTIASRWPMLERTLFPALVQGERAPAELIAQLRRADAMGFDAILLVRGGGSVEDLFCFNDEELVKTIYHMNTYVVTGVGHEIDYTLVDYVSDHRAVTPTAAAQWVTPDQKEIRATLAAQKQYIEDTARRIFNQNAQALMNLQNSVWLSRPETWIIPRRQRWEQLDQALHQTLPSTLSQARANKDRLDAQLNHALQSTHALHQQQLSALQARLLMASPDRKLASQKQELAFMQRNLCLQMERLNTNSHANWISLQRALIRQSPKGILLRDRQAVENMYRLLYANSPAAILEKGYAIVYANGHQIHSPAQAQVSDTIQIQLYDGHIQALVQDAVSTDQPFFGYQPFDPSLSAPDSNGSESRNQ